jgi:hypothetical protein
VILGRQRTCLVTPDASVGGAELDEIGHELEKSLGRAESADVELRADRDHILGRARSVTRVCEQAELARRGAVSLAARMIAENLLGATAGIAQIVR